MESRTLKPTSRRSSTPGIAKLLLLGLAFHLVYIGSVFDCYFTSPVIHGMKSYGAHLEGDRAPAKRLVLIVGDGLRADLLFNLNAFENVPGSSEITAPHLRNIAETRGAFGISHTRVPTESRPGHVAIIGGMYEDVSAVTKGWKTNPVDFDSVFNQSSATFSFGSPDILPMFATGATPGKVRTWSYNEDEEDFTKDATALDVWVLDQLKSLLNNATTDNQLMEDLQGDKVVFFLHLLGLDTTGHSYRPHSKEYMDNIRVVDGIVFEAEKLMLNFYGDDETSFIFTADHGMSAIGNHGDGHPDNTRTPIIAWGKGIRGPLPDSIPSSHDEYSKPWSLNRLYRRDVDQADIASLMAALVGIDWPVNSVGVLPDVDPTRPGYLDAGDEAVAKASLVNAKVILEQYRVKHVLKKTHTLFYRPFVPLANVFNTDDAPHILDIEKLLVEKQWNSARKASSELIQQSLRGLHYLQTYDRFLIRAFVTAAYSGWAAYASLSITRPSDGLLSSPSFTKMTSSLTLASWVVLLAFWGVFAMQRSPWTFYIYIAFPCYFWQQFLTKMAPLVYLRREKTRGLSLGWMAVQVSEVVIALLGMVAGYTHRSIWSIGFVLIGVVWPLTWAKGDIKANFPSLVGWALACLITAVFPLLSVDKTESLLTIMTGGIFMLVVELIAGLASVGGGNPPKNPRAVRKLFGFQSLFIMLMMVITAFSVRSLQAKRGLPLLNQIAGWIILIVASAFPFVYPTPVNTHTKYTKVVMYFLGFCPCFVILSISVEGLFFVSYSLTLAAWVYVEYLSRFSPERSWTDEERRRHFEALKDDNGQYNFNSDDFRIALFFLFFVQVGFFGTGNVASISSFYLAPVYRLIPIFNPFYMSTLLMFKIIAPYIMLSVMLALLNDKLGLPPFSLLLVALTITDGMTLMFFFRVQDTGSWLEIGQSITFFCISSLLLLWSAGICAAGEYLMADVLGSRAAELGKNQKSE